MTSSSGSTFVSHTHFTLLRSRFDDCDCGWSTEILILDWLNKLMLDFKHSPIPQPNMTLFLSLTITLFYILLNLTITQARLVKIQWTIGYTSANPDGLFERTVVGVNGQWPWAFLTSHILTFLSFCFCFFFSFDQIQVLKGFEIKTETNESNHWLGFDFFDSISPQPVIVNAGDLIHLRVINQLNQSTAIQSVSHIYIWSFIPIDSDHEPFKILISSTFFS